AAAGHIINNALFANVLYGFNTDSRYTPYIGAGIGPDFISVQNFGASNTGYLRGDTVQAAYQGIAGISAQLDDNWSVSADYRYVASFDPKVSSTSGGQGRTDNASNNIILGVTYSFGTPAPVEPAPELKTAEAPVVTPRAPMQPAVAPIPQSYMVFFDFDKSTLTPEAKRIIASAAKEYKNGHYVTITVTGHTDTVGTVAYNKKLSVRRAKAVKKYLAALGVPSKDVKAIGVGKNGLMVPTANGVREAQNRRAEIVLVK
ncbi:MAG: OmpA family protein, partial [Alphaproteobacteria bacterium]|nr:OmpA family protein [Alphaproteobacteria bacterium]